MAYQVTNTIPARQGWDVTLWMEHEGKEGWVTFYWPQKDKPDEKILSDKAVHLVNNFIDFLNQVEVKDTFTRDEVEASLKEKGYLTGEQTFEELASKEAG